MCLSVQTSKTLALLTGKQLCLVSVLPFFLNTRPAECVTVQMCIQKYMVIKINLGIIEDYHTLLIFQIKDVTIVNQKRTILI